MVGVEGEVMWPVSPIKIEGPYMGVKLPKR